MTVADTLLQEFRAGSESALDRIMSVYLKPLTFFATKLIGAEEIAEEIVSDSFVTLHQRRENFHAFPAIKSFLYVSTRNACVNYLKSTARKQSLVQTSLLAGEQVEYEQDDILTQMIYTELVQTLYEEIEKLPGQQGLIFRLSYLNGLNTSEIAQKLNISSNAVALGRSRAKRKLKALFGKKKLLFILMFLNFYALG